MKTSNHELTVSKGRFEALSDGIFAVAMTLLVLEIRLPSNIDRSSSTPQQVHALVSIWPQYFVYVATFATIGIMWMNHHALLDRAQRITQGIIMANFCLLGLICFLPFTVYVLEVFGVTPPAAVLYGLTNVGIGGSYGFVQRAARKAHGRGLAPITAWNYVGLTAYPIATIVAFVFPLLSIFIIAMAGVFYALPNSIDYSHRALGE